MNGAIPHDLRPLAGEAIFAGCEQPNGRMRRYSSEDINRLAHVATRLQKPGPPYVSTADCYGIFEAIGKLERATHGDLVPAFGYTIRVEPGVGRGYHITEFDQHVPSASMAVRLAYTQHLSERGVLPHGVATPI